MSEEAQTAWDRSGAYEWQGEPVTWAYRQRYLWLAVARYGQFPAELDWLLVAWIGQLDKKGMRNAEREWRRDRDAFIDEFMDFADQFPESGDEVKQAGELFAQIWDDEDASRDEVDAPEAQADDGAPKKSPAQPTTLTACAALPD